MTITLWALTEPPHPNHVLIMLLRFPYSIQYMSRTFTVVLWDVLVSRQTYCKHDLSPCLCNFP